MLIKNLVRNRMAIIGQESNTGVCQNTGKSLKITSEDRLDEMKSCIILTLIRQIIESKTFMSTIRSASISVSMMSIGDCENNMEKVLLSNLKMVGTYTRVSPTQCYKQFGNSIAVPVLMAIFSQLGLKGVPKWNELSQEQRQELVDRNMDFLSKKEEKSES